MPRSFDPVGFNNVVFSGGFRSMLVFVDITLLDVKKPSMQSR